MGKVWIEYEGTPVEGELIENEIRDYLLVRTRLGDYKTESSYKKFENLPMIRKRKQEQARILFSKKLEELVSEFIESYGELIVEDTFYVDTKCNLFKIYIDITKTIK